MKGEIPEPHAKSQQPGVQIASTYTLVAGIYCLSFCLFFYFLAANVWLAIIHLLAFVTVSVNYIILKQTGHFKRAINIILGTGTVVVVALFASGGWGRSGYLWPFAYLPFATFLTCRKNTLYWVLTLFGGCLFMVGLHLAGLITIPYSGIEMFNFFAAMMVFSVCIFVYQKSTVDYEYFLAYTSSLLEAGKDPFFTINTDGKINDANKAAEKFTGLPVKVLIGSGIGSCFTEAQKAEEICRAVFNDGISRSVPLLLLHKNGNTTWVLFNAILYRDESSNANRVFANARDISEQGAAEAALRESEERYRLLVENVSDYAIFMIDPDGYIMSWNRGAERIKGYKTAEILAKHISIFYTDEENRLNMPAFNLKMAKEQGGFESEGLRVKKDGSLFWADVVFTSLYDPQGNLRGFTKITRDVTEKKNAADAIARQAALFQVLPDAIIYGAKEGLTITSMNTAAEQMFGISLDEAKNKGIDDIVDSTMVGATRGEVQKHLWQGAGYWRGEAVFTMRNGKRLNVLSTIRTIKDHSGKETGWLAIYTDITPIKVTEERLQIALDGMEAGLWEWDIKGNKRWWGKRYFELLGYKNNEIEASAETLRDLVHPDDRELLFKGIADNIEGKDRLNIAVRYKTKSGVYKWFRAHGKTVFDEKGKPLRMVGTIIDIDKHRKADILINQQAQLIQMLPDGIIYGDMGSKITSINAGAEKMFEMTNEDVAGKTIDDVLTFKLKGSTREGNRTELATKGFARMEAEVTTRSGKKMEVLGSVKIIVNADSLPGWVAIYTDITALKLNEELKEALKKVEANNEYMEQLAYISSHDIKSPIIALDGLANVLLNANAVKPEYSEVLKMFKDTVNQMQRTNHSLNNILKLRKNLLRREDISDQSYSLQSIINDVKVTLQSNLDEAKAFLEIELDDVSDVHFPYVHIKSIFLNLLTNAIKYRDPARLLVIRINAKKEADKFSFTIADNGLGMNLTQNKDKLFGIFKRFHDHVEGSGVGLHIVKSIVDAYNGTIEVESAEGKGTSFKISFNTTITPQ